MNGEPLVSFDQDPTKVKIIYEENNGIVRTRIKETNTNIPLPFDSMTPDKESGKVCAQNFLNWCTDYSGETFEITEEINNNGTQG